MRLHELVPYEGLDLIVHDTDSGLTKVLTCEGAVFDFEDTNELRNMSIACGAFLHDTWRIATTSEVQAFRTAEDDRMLKLEWVPPPPRVRIAKE